MGLLVATRVVLIAPSLPENVGSVARAMRHFGLKELVLVGGVGPLHPLARAVSAGSEAILEAARVVDDLETALGGAVLVLGTTARAQTAVGRVAIAPREAAALAAAHAEAGPVALVFGTEKSGMTNSDLARCHQVVTIPGEGEACLNLAQALTILAYEWRLSADVPGDRPLTAWATGAGLDDVALQLTDALAARGLIQPRDHAAKRHTFARLLSRLKLSEDEARMLLGLARAAGRLSQ